MKLVLNTLVLTALFCLTFAHEQKTCKTNNDCGSTQFCSMKKVCQAKFYDFCQNALTCQLKFGKNSRCLLRDNENYGNCQKLYVPGAPCT